MSLHWLGHLLRNVRANEKHSLAHHPELATVPQVIRLTSAWYGDGQRMPQRTAGLGQGENISPPLSWTGVPAGTAELALVMEDPDVPFPRPIIHMVAYGIAPGSTGLAEGALREGASGLVFGKGTLGRQGYSGPRPPPGHGAHRYVFYILALSRKTEFAAPPKLKEFMACVAGSIIGRGSLVGMFENK